MKRHLVLLCAAAVAASLSSAASGFESYEHVRLGDLAFRVALEYYRSDKKDPRALVELEKRMNVGAQDKVLSYGRVVACVDYFLYPEKILVELRTRNYNLLEPSGGLKGKVQDFIDPEQCHRLGGEFFQATHNNHAHFGHGALMSYKVLHLAAITARDQEQQMSADDRMQWAIVMNAIADHYLHDFFAPGHIFTQRERLSDVYARSRHDDYNYEGSSFVPKLGGLEDLVDFICGRENKSKPCTPRAEFELPAKLAGKPQEIGAALDAMLGGELVLLRGDDLLWSATREQLKQRLLMLLVSARSVLDVLEGKNTFNDLDFVQKVSDRNPSSAKVEYGEYGLGRTGFAITTPNLTIVGASLARESMTSGSSAGRNVLTLETALGIAAPSSGDAKNFVPFLGFTYYKEGAIQGRGLSGRLAFVWPQTEFSYGPYLRYLSYPTTDRDVKRFSGGFRVDSGFSSFFTVFLAIGRDHGTTPDRVLGSGLLFTGGVAVLLPTSLLPRRKLSD